MSNPLLEDHRLPPFSRIRPEHVEPAITQLIEETRAGITQVLQQQRDYTWENLVAPIEALSDRLAKAWSPVGHLNAVVNSDALRAAYNACLPKLADLRTWMGQHEGLFKAYRAIADSPQASALGEAQRKALEHALRDFHLGGVDLPAAQKTRFGELQSRLSELSSSFGDNVLDATKAWSHRVESAEQLPGLPASALAGARQRAEAQGLSGYLINLEFPSFYPVLTYCDDRALREAVYQANVTRASDQGPNSGAWDNSAIIAETLALRHELAQLLGYGSYAELALATRMAETPAQVIDFLRDLSAHSKPQAMTEYQALQDFAREHHGIDALQAWDVAYYSEKLRQHRFAVSDEDIKPYLPADRVLNGLLEVTRRLFGVTARPVSNFDSYHPDVLLYEVCEQDNGEVIALFYLDLYARRDKRGGAWMDDCRVRRRTAHGLQLPVAYLTCNFTPPVGEQPALLDATELTTLFHEFGHGLHHMLTRQDVAAVSGINGVAWDAVELPSQFFENWCWEPDALAFISGHFETGEPLPKDLLDKLLAVRNFQSAMMMQRQLEFALFDFRLHSEYTPEQPRPVLEVLQEVRDEIAVIQPPPYNRAPHAFSHVFAGGYAAGYYSYKWAEVLSADAYSRFEEEGIFNARTGADFRQHILEMGGAREPMALFVAFRGREPKVDALLRHSGIAA